MPILGAVMDRVLVIQIASGIVRGKIAVCGGSMTLEEIEKWMKDKEPQTIDNWEPLQEWWYHMKELISYCRELEADLKLNSSMLAKQCDLAREAEARVKELEEILNRYKNAADGYIKI